MRESSPCEGVGVVKVEASGLAPDVVRFTAEVGGSGAYAVVVSDSGSAGAAISLTTTRCDRTSPLAARSGKVR